MVGGVAGVDPPLARRLGQDRGQPGRQVVEDQRGGHLHLDVGGGAVRRRHMVDGGVGPFDQGRALGRVEGAQGPASVALSGMLL